MKKMILIAFVALFSATTFAQTTKVGTVDADYTLSQMPELKGAQDALKVYNQDLEKQLADKLTNYDKVYKAAEAGFAAMTDAEKKAKQEELATLESDITKFRNNGTQLVQLKQNELLQPLYQKIGENVAIVAKELGYTQILNIGNNNNLAYIDPTHDITLKVLAKMGITVKQE
ncbi:OmpH family outer membrane protein [Dokdonia pacifica]|uniref:Periplasmic chaperone for outer membrane proteins Skp n=1 Tax=Dokdonia pacifica TaxID=1627892 RepID=A0A238YYB8_9FLAO|nr:OmpH family outer membrane protein [Dokdonia pacifica]SNR76060.1 periplasmic chaperone for outer membrane proteins Skp [Dokdonia pacifica]